VAIVGLGMVGGSLARALTRAGYRVIGVDRAAVLRRARAAGALAAGSTRVEEAAREADVVVLAAPPRANLALLGRLARAFHLRSRARARREPIAVRRAASASSSSSAPSSSRERTRRSPSTWATPTVARGISAMRSASTATRSRARRRARRSIA